eukprot:gb/GECH01014157.1/.p1 GENE.gb/GECH01014157.1/~~gb/GECH01014157.1/.p1  ORF type:complete len:271 (+),score=74.29 gb/GECH01014157.1/:1-813(+)
MPISLKIRNIDGTVFTLRKLDDDTTLELLKVFIFEQSDVIPEEQKLFLAQSRQEIEGNDDDKIKDIGIRHGETLIVQKRNRSGDDAIIRGKSQGPYIPPSDKKGSFVRRTVPPDNSCLFHACSYVLYDKSRSHGSELRNLVANIVQENPHKFSSSFLGMPNLEYVHLIGHPDMWGGAIELRILSDYFKTEIVAFDCQTTREDHYGEENNYSTRVLLIYTGRHYDALALAPFGGAPETRDQVRFNSRDNFVLAKAREMVQEEFEKQFSGGS